MATVIDVINNRCGFMDIIFLGGNDLISNLIRDGQDTQTPDGKPSKWSHVCFYINKTTILESTLEFEKYKDGSIFSNGVQFYSLEDRLKSSGYHVSIARPDTSAGAIFDSGLALLRSNTKYPIWGLIGSLLTYKFFKGWRDNPLTKHKLYCSAFVAESIDDPEISARQLKYLPYPYNSYYFDNISPELLYQMYQDNVVDIVEKGSLI